LLAAHGDFVMALRQSDLSFRRPSATGPLGRYPGRTSTGKSIAAWQDTPHTAIRLRMAVWAARSVEGRALGSGSGVGGLAVLGVSLLGTVVSRSQLVALCGVMDAEKVPRDDPA